ncbi:hypothetical protein [Bacillus cereus]|nr:hypothetical protein [Bacillus cereus]
MNNQVIMPYSTFFTAALQQLSNPYTNSTFDWEKHSRMYGKTFTMDMM